MARITKAEIEAERDRLASERNVLRVALRAFALGTRPDYSESWMLPPGADDLEIREIRVYGATHMDGGIVVVITGAGGDYTQVDAYRLEPFASRVREHRASLPSPALSALDDALHRATARVRELQLTAWGPAEEKRASGE